MATIETNVSRQFKDLDLRFTKHPLKKDVSKNLDQVAVIYSIKNLILTNHYEKPFNPDYGSNVRKLLFETIDIITANALENEIQETIKNFEPRVSILGISVFPDIDANGFRVDLQFSIINQTEAVSVSFLLERTR
jgi:phage baseplate assembly protein W